MSSDDIHQFQRELLWGLKQLAVWGESTDPHIQHEAKSQAKVTMSELARDVQPELENGEIYERK
jgi:hypothetical protein